MKKLFGLITLLVCTCTGVVQAQFDAQFSQYFLSMGYYNPGFAGTSEDLNLFAIHRQQWVGITRAPQSTFAMADMPIHFGQSTHGVGAIFYSGSEGLWQNMQVAGQYAYKKKLWGGVLSVGVQAGILNQVFHGELVETSGGDEEGQTDTGTGTGSGGDSSIPNTTVEGMTLDVNFGAYYTRKDFYAGFAVMHAIEPEINLGENYVNFIPRMFNLTAGYNIQTRNPLYQLQPSMFVKVMQNTFAAEVTARVVYNKMFNGGLSWRVTDSGSESVVALLGVTFGRFQAGYAYDFPLSAILKESSGSHELVVRYSFKLKKTQTGKNRHKSVRIL